MGIGQIPSQNEGKILKKNRLFSRDTYHKHWRPSDIILKLWPVLVGSFFMWQPLRNVIVAILQLKFEMRRMTHLQKSAIKTSTFSTLSSWNLMKTTASSGDSFHQVLSGLAKECGFFSNDQFLKVLRFFLPRLHLNLNYNKTKEHFGPWVWEKYLGPKSKLQIGRN